MVLLWPVPEKPKILQRWADPANAKALNVFLLKARIYQKTGDKAGAKSTAENVIVMATEAKTSRLDLRLTEEERDLYQRAAEHDGRTLSNWIRDRLNKAARAELGDGTVKGKGKRPSP